MMLCFCMVPFVLVKLFVVLVKSGRQSCAIFVVDL